MEKLRIQIGTSVLCVVLLLGLLPIPAQAAKGTEGLSPAEAQAFAALLEEQLGRYGQGALSAEASATPAVAGLLYAQAGDLDGDGCGELVLTRAQDMTATLEIYRTDGSGCQQIYTSQTYYSGGYSVDSIGLCTAADGTCHLFARGWTMQGGEEITADNRYTLEGTPVTTHPVGQERALIGYNTGYLEAATNDVSGVLGQLRQAAAAGTAKGTASAETLLGQLPYIGDRSLCRMDAAMARAYAQAIRSQSPAFYDQYSGISYPLHAVLVDGAGDGMPLLTMAFTSGEPYSDLYDVGIWTWDGVSAARYPFEEDIEGAYMGGYQFGSHDGKSTLYITDSISGAVEMVSGTLYYEIADGMLYLREKNTQYRAYCADGITATGTKLPLVDAQRVDEYSVSAPVQDLLDAGWRWANECELILFSVNDRIIPPDEDLGGSPFIPREGGQILSEASGSYFLENTWGSGETVQQQLLDYADALQAGPDYRYPAVTREEDPYASAAAQAAAEAGGEVSAIYQLSQGIYYVILTAEGGTRGVLVQGVRRSGEVVWQVTQTHEAPLEPGELEALLAQLLAEPNLTVDYSQVNSGDLEEVKEYLQSVLDNMDGLTPNDAAKQVLAEAVESALTAGCSGAVTGQDNRLTLDGAGLDSLTERAVEMIRALEGLLTDNGVALNRPLTARIRVLWSNLDWGAPCQVTLDQGLLDAMGDCTVQVLLGDGQHGLQLSPETVKDLVTAHGSVAVRLAAGEEGVYTVQFLDSQGNLLEQLDSAVTLFLPCASPLATVMATYRGGSDNWGGQYDEGNGVILFDVRYPGDYQVLENSVEIDDIGDLPQEVQQAIRFMVSKGYFSLEEGKFLPQDPLNRYAFSEALVGMFFALDRQLQTSFPDVPAESPYYPYVASGEHSHIIEGLGDGTFGGEIALTVEQMLALAARTLMEQKGYTAPADAQRYVSGFSDGLETSDWAVEQAALAIREGLLDPGGALRPQEAVTRAQAALILYRLFLLLHEVSPVALDLPPVTQLNSTAQQAGTDTLSAVIVPAAAAVLIAGGAGAVWYWLRRGKHA